MGNFCSEFLSRVNVTKHHVPLDSQRDGMDLQSQNGWETANVLRVTMHSNNNSNNLLSTRFFHKKQTFWP